MKIVEKRIDELKPYLNNPRFNDDAVKYVANSIKEFGFKVPLVIDKDGTIITGHTRYKASIELGLEKIPCIIADDLNEEQIKAFRLADNKVSEMSSWNLDFLEEELNDIDLDMEEFGFKEFEDTEIERTDISDKEFERYEIIISCKDEKEQEAIYNKLEKEGYECRLLTL